MSDKRRFLELICELAQAHRWDALERIEARAVDILVVVQAEHLLMEGWRHEDKRTDDSD